MYFFEGIHFFTYQRFCGDIPCPSVCSGNDIAGQKIIQSNEEKTVAVHNNPPINGIPQTMKKPILAKTSMDKSIEELASRTDHRDISNLGG